MASKLSKIDVDSFYGIEFEEFPVEIARVALWLTDHLANMELSAEFGIPYFRLPLTHTPNIVHGNALRLDWREVVGELDDNLFILGNPPFVGQNLFERRTDRRHGVLLFSDVQISGLLTMSVLGT